MFVKATPIDAHGLKIQGEGQGGFWAKHLTVKAVEVVGAYT